MFHAAAVQAIHQQVSDPDLVSAVRAGGSEAMTALFDRHHHAAETVARRTLSCPADVDDAVAEAFTRVFERLATLRNPACFRAFLLSCVRNVARDRRRGAGRLVADDLLVQRPHPAVSVETAVEAAEQRGRLVIALRHLPPRQRHALVRFYWEDAPVAQIAAELMLSNNATTQLLFRARANLARANLCDGTGVAPRQSIRRSIGR